MSEWMLESVNQTIRQYRREYAVKPRFMSISGEMGSGGIACVDALPLLHRVRVHALDEAVRWGEPCVFFLAPGILSWIVPLVDGRQVRGGIIGGEVVAEDEPEDRLEGINHLVACGASRKEAQEFVRALPAWPQLTTQEAADRLWTLFYSISGWSPLLLNEHRDKALQQREIAEEIHRRKASGQRDFPFLEERKLLSLIRSGDRKGARRLLNQYLGAVFLQSPELVVVRALMIELFGYLVRTAVQDSIHLDSLVERNHKWTGRIVRAHGFEELAHVVKAALDDFMDSIYLLSYQKGHPGVGKALDFIARHYHEKVTLRDVAGAVGLSTYRVAHLVKEQTGRTILQHVHEMRIREAQRLLEETQLSCAEIAYGVGFTDQSYFTRQFGAHTGITPLRHRRLYLSRMQSAKPSFEQPADELD